MAIQKLRNSNVLPKVRENLHRVGTFFEIRVAEIRSKPTKRCVFMQSLWQISEKYTGVILVRNDFSMIFIRNLTNFNEFCPNFERVITFDGDVLRRWFFNRWKALNLSFPIWYFLLKFDLRTVPKRRFRIGTSDFGNSVKITKMQISPCKNAYRTHYEFWWFSQNFRKSEVPIRNRLLVDRPEVEIQQKVPNWKAESLSFPTVEESAPEDITIKSYGPFEIIDKINQN